jgi:hypothetical protein
VRAISGRPHIYALNAGLIVVLAAQAILLGIVS